LNSRAHSNIASTLVSICSVPNLIFHFLSFNGKKILSEIIDASSISQVPTRNKSFSSEMNTKILLAHTVAVKSSNDDVYSVPNQRTKLLLKLLLIERKYTNCSPWADLLSLYSPTCNHSYISGI